MNCQFCKSTHNLYHVTLITDGQQTVMLVCGPCWRVVEQILGAGAVSKSVRPIAEETR